MKRVFIHLSDLHLKKSWPEEQGVVLQALFTDMKAQVAKNSQDAYLIFSGDLVLAGADESLYEQFHETFDRQLLDIGIDRSKRICVPGNHDLSRDVLREDLLEHESLVSRNIPEHQFNDYCTKEQNLFQRKFANYRKFETQFAHFGIGTATGSGWNLSNDLGVFCMNSALCSSGGLAIDDATIIDNGRLAVDTRRLHEWLQSCNAKWKVLITHHPLTSLTEWARRELTTVLEKNFCLHFSGHSHDQSVTSQVVQEGSMTWCSAPALFTRKTEELGYALVTVCDERGPLSIRYRQWTRKQKFVTGGNFSNTDNGERLLILPNTPRIVEGDLIPTAKNFHAHIYLQKFLGALRSYANQPSVWVAPSIRLRSELDTNEVIPEISIDSLLSDDRSILLKAPPQYGLTSLGLFLCAEAAKAPDSPLWLYLDLALFGVNATDSFVQQEIALLGGTSSQVSRIVVDGFTNHDKSSQKKLVRISEYFKDRPLTVLQTVDEHSFGVAAAEWPTDRKFEVMYLWSLSRSKIKHLVVQYNDQKPIGDDQAVLQRIAADLEVLNLPRTALNCLTILKALEFDFDESPVNRTEMIKRVLFILFNTEDVPTYKTKPDLKDCEYILGWFCEQMIKKNDYEFDRENFIADLKEFCRRQVIALEVHVVFDVLASNGIIVKRGGAFCFRFSYWVYYFAAQRMHQDAEFANYMFSSSRYVSFPEMIEFYTGIDRRREDALVILTADINNVRKIVDEKCGVPDEIDPFRFVKWQPSSSYIEQVKAELSEGARRSRLPDSVKDEFADKDYDRARPYNQRLANILTEYSLRTLMRTLKGAARALRNSDYASPVKRRAMLEAILGGWVLLGKVLLVLSPVLAEKRAASFDGASFVLSRDFAEDRDARLNQIVTSMPTNIVKWYREDVFSQKMAPLLMESLSSSDGVMAKHLVYLLLVKDRPNNWRKVIEGYVASLAKDSFYIYDIYMALVLEYRFATVSDDVLKDIEYVMKMCLAKHQTGNERPGKMLIRRISDRFLPKRSGETEQN